MNGPPPGVSPQMPDRPHGPPRHRRKTPRLLLPLALGLVLVAGIVAGAWVYRHQRNLPSSLATHTVRYEQVQPTVVARGDLGAAEYSNIVCRVRSLTHGGGYSTSINWIVDNGVRVQRGQLLVQLDDSDLQEQLRLRTVLLDEARAAWVQAEENHKILQSQNQGAILTAQTAVLLDELELKKYREGDYEQSRKTLEGQIVLADAVVGMWHDRVGWLGRMARKGFQTPAQARAEESAMQTAGSSLGLLREQYRVLREFTHKHTQASLESKLAQDRRALDHARRVAEANHAQTDADRLSKRRIYEQRLALCHDIEEQILLCTITAPHDGLVVYYMEEERRRGRGSEQAVVTQGEPVREGQILMRLPNVSRPIVHVLIHEALGAQVRGEEWQLTGFGEAVEAALLTSPDLPARLLAGAAFAELRPRFQDRERRLVYGGHPASVRFPAYPHVELRGRVKYVSPIATLESRRTDLWVYHTLVALEETFESLRPGMSAQVTIRTGPATAPVLAVPLDAIVRSPEGGRNCSCYVAGPEGPEERDIVVGVHNDQLAEVRSGLQEGEEVIRNAQAVLGEKEQETGLLGF